MRRAWWLRFEGASRTGSQTKVEGKNHGVDVTLSEEESKVRDSARQDTGRDHSLPAIVGHALMKAKMGLHVYEGANGGSHVGRRVKGGRKRQMNRLTDAQSPVDDDAGRVSEQPVEVPLLHNSAFCGGGGRLESNWPVSEMLRRGETLSGG